MVSPDPKPNNSLKYTILGQDLSSMEEKLAKYQGTVNWSYLAPHLISEVLIFVDPQLPLPLVGKAFTENNTQLVAEWLKTGDLVKISELHAAQWNNTSTEFEALVVSPFVLFRPCK